jgi:hypothetical protein
MNTAWTRRPARIVRWRAILFTVAASASAALTAAQTAEARVTRFVVEERVPFAPGTE